MFLTQKFKKLISEGKINSVVVSQRYLRGYDKVQEGNKEPLFPNLLYVTPRVDDPSLVDFLERNNAEIIAENENTFLMTSCPGCSRLSFLWEYGFGP